MGDDSPVQDAATVLHREVAVQEVWHGGRKLEGITSCEISFGTSARTADLKPWVSVDFGDKEVAGTLVITHVNPDWYWWMLGAPGASDHTDLELVHAPGLWEIPGTAAHGAWVGCTFFWDETWRPQSDRELRFARAAARFRGIDIVETAVFGVYQAVHVGTLKDLVRSKA